MALILFEVLCIQRVPGALAALPRAGSEAPSLPDHEALQVLARSGV